MIYDRIPDELYKEILENMPICCVDVIIHRDNEVLLIYRKEEPVKDTWWTPGGRVLKNEPLREAVKRKMKEELGIDVDIEKSIGAYELMFDTGIYPDLETGTHGITNLFLVKPKNDISITLDDTSEEYRWVDKVEDDFHPYLKKFLKDSNIFNK